MSQHQPPHAPLDSPQMMYSRSTGALHNRLRPQNENIVASTSNLSVSGLNTIKPKNMMSVTQSTPNLLGTEGGHPAPIPSKAATLLRSDISMASLMGHKTLSNSQSAQVLLGKGTVPRSTSPAHKLRDQINTSEWDHETPVKEFAEFSFSPTRRPDSPSNRSNGSGGFEDNEGIDKEHYIHVPRNSFLASLNLSQRQLFDLYKVPHTFFYLRVKEGQPQRSTTSNNNHTGSPSTGTRRPHSNDFTSDGRGNAGSVYDLELVSLDQVDKNNYFTLSKEGVTQFRNKLSTFTGLSQWEREYRLFHKIANINFFKIYKRWKVSFRHNLIWLS